MLSSVKRVLTCGEASALLRPALSFCTIGAGVPCGTNTLFDGPFLIPAACRTWPGNVLVGRSRPFPVCVIAFTSP